MTSEEANPRVIRSEHFTLHQYSTAIEQEAIGGGKKKFSSNLIGRKCPSSDVTNFFPPPPSYQKRWWKKKFRGGGEKNFTVSTENITLVHISIAVICLGKPKERST
jgi:hypothetical protein